MVLQFILFSKVFYRIDQSFILDMGADGYAGIGEITAYHNAVGQEREIEILAGTAKIHVDKVSLRFKNPVAQRCNITPIC